jgi:hypothetical protein
MDEYKDHCEIASPSTRNDVADSGGSMMSLKPDHGMGQAAKVGYTYYVSEEQLAQHAALTILERLTWLDQTRQFVLLAETEQTAARRARLRNENPEFSSFGDA